MIRDLDFIRTGMRDGKFIIIFLSERSLSAPIMSLIERFSGPQDYLEPDAAEVKIRTFLQRRNQVRSKGGAVVVTAQPNEDVSTYVVGLPSNDIVTLTMALTDHQIRRIQDNYGD